MTELVVTAANWAEHSEALIALRTEVFVREQQVPAEIEVDGRDADCLHVMATEVGVCVGTARLLPNGFIGRMCVLKSCRSRGIGTLMLHKLLQLARQQGYAKISLNSQASAIRFYQRNGFVIDSEEFIEAGIPHRRMILID